MNTRVDQGQISLEQILTENQKKQEIQIKSLILINKTHDKIFKDFFDHLQNSYLSSDQLSKNLTYLKQQLDYNFEEHEHKISPSKFIQGKNIYKLLKGETQIKVSQEPLEKKTGFEGTILDILPVSQNELQTCSQVKESTQIEGKRQLRERRKKNQTLLKHTVKKKNYYKKKLIKKEKCSICDARLVDFYGLVLHEKNYHNIIRHPEELINLKIEE